MAKESNTPVIPANWRFIASTGKTPNATEIALWRQHFDGALAARLIAACAEDFAVETALTNQIITPPKRVKRVTR